MRFAETVVRNVGISKDRIGCARDTGVCLHIERFRRDRRGHPGMARPAIRESLAQFGCPVIPRGRVDGLLEPVVCRRLASGDQRGGETPQCFL